MKSVAIIGAGITGLTAAFYLQRHGFGVAVYEAAGRAGGVIQSVRRDGFLAECGPNTLLETSHRIAQLIEDAGLASRRLYSDPGAEARYLVHDRRPVAMPNSPLQFFTTRLFTAKAKLAVLREPFVPRRTDGREESVAEFVTRRLNREFLDRAIDALAAGVYAGDPDKLSLPQAFPRLAELEARYGSLIKGQIFGARERKARGETARDRAPKFSFDEGLQVLPDTLASRIGDALRLNTQVTRLTQIGSGWRISIPSGEMEYDAIVYCGTAYGLAELKIDTNRPLFPTDGNTGGQSKGFQSFSGIRYPPVASVVLGFRREDVAHPCQGFGMLIPKLEGFKILGTIFSSSLFPNRAPAGHVTLTSYVGGERHPDLASQPADDLVALTCDDLRALLGVRGRPVFRHTTLYRRAIPQYNLGYGGYRERMNEIESQAAGFFLAGHYREGVALGDSIVSGRNVVERVEKYLTAK